MALHPQLADEVAGQIEAGVFQPGDRLPSAALHVCSAQGSPATLLQAYYLLDEMAIFAVQ